MRATLKMASDYTDLDIITFLMLPVKIRNFSSHHRYIKNSKRNSDLSKPLILCPSFSAGARTVEAGFYSNVFIFLSFIPFNNSSKFPSLVAYARNTSSAISTIISFLLFAVSWVICLTVSSNGLIINSLSCSTAFLISLGHLFFIPLANTSIRGWVPFINMSKTSFSIRL